MRLLQPEKGQVMLSGKANKAKFKNVSTGPIDASKLALKQANRFIFGTGNIDCLPSEQLRIYGAGTGKVYYHTTPEKSQTEVSESKYIRRQKSNH